MKKKISAFEFAIMQVADPEKAKDYEALTKEEENEIRIAKLRSQAQKMQVKSTTLTNNK